MRLIVSLLATLLAASIAIADPAADGGLALRASTAFAAGDYAKALPLLRSLGQSIQHEPDRAAAIQEQIRVCEKQLTAAPVTQPAATSVTPAVRTPHLALKPGETLDTSIKALGNFEFDENHPVIPEDVKALTGSSVRLHGFMVPLDQTENISRFALVPSLTNCCIGQPPQIQHTILVTCPKGKAVQYCSEEIIVDGQLTVGAVQDDGYIVGIFRVIPASVKPAVK
jgi:hypothetical protein